MKKLTFPLAAIGRPELLVLSLTMIALMLTVAISPVRAAVNTATPVFEDHEGEEASFDPAAVSFSAEQTILGAYSVKMVIPEGAIPPDRWGLGLNVETRLATGMSRRQGLALYTDISFKAYFDPPLSDPNNPTSHAPLYLSLILYDQTNDLWVSMIPTCAPYVCWGGARMGFSDPDGNGWRTATPVGGSDALWTAWTFGGAPWPVAFPDNIMTLSQWDEYIAANNLDVKVRKVNIQFGYRPPVVYQDWDADGTPEPHDLGVAWGTVYLDGLSFAGRTLDFEPVE